MPIRLGLALMLICGAVAGGAVGEPHDEQPVAETAPAAVASDHVMHPVQRRAAFYRSRIVDLYREVYGQEPGAEAVLAFLEDAVVYFAYEDFPQVPRPPDHPDSQALLKQRDVLQAEGASDRGRAVVDLIAAVLDLRVSRRDMGVDGPRLTSLHQAAELDGWADRKAGLLICIGHLLLPEVQLPTETGRDWRVDLRVGYANVYAALFDPGRPLRAADAAELARLFNKSGDDLPVRELGPLLIAIGDLQGLPPNQRWLAQCLNGIICLNQAWIDRGYGWAAEGRESHWLKFQVTINLAELELRSAWSLRQDLSEPAYQMIIVMMARGDQRKFDWFERAIAADPLDHEAWRQIQWATQRRWGGTAEQTIELAERALASDNFHTGVPDRFLVGLHRLVEDHGHGHWRRNRARLVPQLERYLERRLGLLSPEFPAPSLHADAFAYFYAAAEIDRAWHHFKALDGDATQLRNLYRLALDSRFAPGWAATSQHPQAKAALIQAMEQYDAGEYAAALETIQATLPQITEPWVRQHLEDTRQIVVWSRDFARGDEVDLLEHGLQGWRPYRGRWDDDPAEGVSGEALAEGEGLGMYAKMPLGPRFSATLRFKVPDNYRGELPGGAGLILCPQLAWKLEHQTLFGYARRQDAAALYIDGRRNRNDRVRTVGPPLETQDVELTVHRWDDRVRVQINGKTVIDDHRLDTEQHPGCMLGIGGWFDDQSLNCHFESLVVQQLRERPF